MKDKLHGFRPEEIIVPAAETMKKVLLRPEAFFKEMPRSGGMTQPAVFVLVMGGVVAVIRLLLSFVGWPHLAPLWDAVVWLFLHPPMFVAMSFLVALAVFVIWRSMGSSAPFETAYRCVAYTAAVSPIATVVAYIPYLGPIFSIAWTVYLLFLASVHVHNIPRGTAARVFGILGVLLALASVQASCKARQFVRDAETWRVRHETAAENR